MPYIDGLFSDWDIELPKIHGVFSVSVGWKAQHPTTGAITGERCTRFGAPPVARGSDIMGFTPEEYWHGTSLSIPGAGSQEILLRSSVHTKAPGSSPPQYPLVTSQWWALSCLPRASDGGEGFVAVSPEGTRYVFDQLVSRRTASRVGYDNFPTAAAAAPRADATASPPIAPAAVVVPNLPPVPTLNRLEYWMLPSRIEDRHGNWVQYHYANVYAGTVASNYGLDWRLTQITASDGRRIDFTYVPGTRRIERVTVVRVPMARPHGPGAMAIKRSTAGWT